MISILYFFIQSQQKTMRALRQSQWKLMNWFINFLFFPLEILFITPEAYH
jgi:hypothetical protein